MVSLRTSFAALAFSATCQLLQFAVKVFDLPAQVIRFLSDLRGHSLIQVIGDDPVNVAVCGNALEQLHFERNFFEFDNDAIFQLFFCPLDFIKMNIAAFFAQTYQAVRFERCVKNQS